MYFQVIYILNLLSNITNYIIDILYKINNLNNYIIFLNFPSDISSIEQSTKPRFWFFAGVLIPCGTTTIRHS